MEFVLWYLIVAFVLMTLFAIDRHLCLKDVENDLKLYHADALLARDLAEGSAVKVHYQATATAIRNLIRKHFKE